MSVVWREFDFEVRIDVQHAISPGETLYGEVSDRIVQTAENTDLGRPAPNSGKL